MSELNQDRNGMLERVDVEKFIEKIEAHAAARRAVHSKRHV